MNVSRYQNKHNPLLFYFKKADSKNLKSLESYTVLLYSLCYVHAHGMMDHGYVRNIILYTFTNITKISSFFNALEVIFTSPLMFFLVFVGFSPLTL